MADSMRGVKSLCVCLCICQCVCQCVCVLTDSSMQVHPQPPTHRVQRFLEQVGHMPGVNCFVQLLAANDKAVTAQ